MRLRPKLTSSAAILVLLLAGAVPAAPPVFRVSFKSELHPEPYTGRVYLFFSKNSEPRKGPNWFQPEPIVAKDVAGWKPGEILEFKAEDNRQIAFPKPLAELEVDHWNVQAITRFNPWEREVGTGPGNGYSPVVEVSGEMVSLEIQKLVERPQFVETEYTRLLEVPSPLLTDFHKHPFSLRGAVLLPSTYHEQPERRYPVLFIIPGFGGTHQEASGLKDPVKQENDRGVQFIRIILDPSCPLGHHVFADSANNGPVGKAFLTEFIPALNARYRTVDAPTARFLTGHSSGGWSSLWLQVTYPDSFAAVWSTAPDPVDFRDFQQIEMYAAGENMYRNNNGDRRPLARLGDKVALWYEDFDRMEWALGYGGQLHSFEAVFGPRGSDGRPRLAWDRNTGAVNTEVTKAWEPYDIRLVLERNWKDLGPKLQGKLHVFMGDADTFYLEGATRRLGEILKQLGSDAVVEMFPGKTHFDLLSSDVRKRIRAEMTATFLKHHPDLK